MVTIGVKREQGLRRGELLALAWDDVDLDRGILRVRGTVQRLRGQGLVFGPPKSSRSRPQGVLPRVVLDVLGHSQLSITMDLYSHVMPSALRDAAVAMDRALSEGR